MITFIQLCELLTSNQKYSWFYFDRTLVAHLTPDELSLVHVESINDTTLYRLWYPRSKFTPSVIELHRMFDAAIEAGDFILAKELKNKINAKQTNT